MSVEEDILLHQFGQGVCSLADMLDQFKTLEVGDQRSRLISLYRQLCQSSWNTADIEKALANFSPDEAKTLYDYLHLHRFTARWTGICFIPCSDDPPNGQFDMAYQVLLVLFKLRYQRTLAKDQKSLSVWRQQDLSDTAPAENILIEHQRLVEHVYADPNYRSEFACLAKVWQNNKLRSQVTDPEIPVKTQIPFNFITYDELVADMIAPFTGGTQRGLFLLRQSLNKALAKQYQLGHEQVNWLVVDVINRHLREIHT